MIRYISALIFFLLASCTKKDEKQTLWIYTSLYKDTIAEIKPILEKKFPEMAIQFYQAGSEEIAAKVQAEILSGQIQADLLIASDRFWYEELSNQNKLLAYKPNQSEKVDSLYKHPNDFYTAVSFPVMVLAYNSDVISDKEMPRTFKELTHIKWKDKVSMGSPLASGTAFTSVSFLAEKYNWDYFKDLRKNNFISEGGNSGVIRRLQSKERPIGIVLLENVLRLTKTDPRIKYILPEDGAIVQVNALSIVNKNNDPLAAQKLADWFFSETGQEVMCTSYMYPAVTLKTVDNGPEFSDIKKNAKPWTREFIDSTMKNREKIKDQFSKIVF